MHVMTTDPSRKCRAWMIELRAINRWLRYTGFRMVLSYDDGGEEPARIGLIWWGWERG